MNSLYLNALSTDSFGRQFAELLQSEGTLLDAKTCHEPTSIAVIQLDGQGKATYAFHRNGVADTARKATEIVSNWRSGVTSLHTGCLMLVPAVWLQTRQIMAHATQSGCVVSVDANLRPAVVADHPAYVACVKAACAAAHVVKVSDDDLVTLGLLAPSEASDIQAVVRAARELFSPANTTRLVALTLGERGAWLLTLQHSVFEAAPSGVIVKDTVGAGDSFAAALLAHLRSQAMLAVTRLDRGLAAEGLQAALHHAVAAAALCVQRTGCDPATWKETEDFVRQQE